MTKIRPRHFRILSIAPATKGFGFAVLEGGEKLVNSGFKLITGDKNAGAILKIQELIAHYEPTMIALEDACAKGSKRAPRIRMLAGEVIALAEQHGLAVSAFAREKIMRAFIPKGKGTKHGVAEVVAARFPEDLGGRVPPKRNPWTSEGSRMAIFEAVALAVRVFV